MTIKKVMNSIESALDDASVEYTSDTSKYPSKVLFITTTDENNKAGMLALGAVKSGTTTAFIQASIYLRSAANKKEAMTMIYKIFGLE